MKSDKYADAIDASLRGQEVVFAQSRANERNDGEVVLPDCPVGEFIAQLTIEDKIKVDRFTLYTALVPAFLRVSTIALSNSDLACKYADQISAVCRQVEASAAEPKVWSGSAKLFDALGRGATLEEFRQLAESFDMGNYQALRVMGYLGCAIVGGPDDAFCAHVATFQTILSWYKPASPTYSQILLPYFEEFWLKRFAEARFAFRSPALIEPSLKSAVQQPSGTRAKAILRAVRPAFHIHGLKSELVALMDESKD